MAMIYEMEVDEKYNASLVAQYSAGPLSGPLDNAIATINKQE